jgi:hypothetical protein
MWTRIRLAGDTLGHGKPAVRPGSHGRLKWEVKAVASTDLPRDPLSRILARDATTRGRQLSTQSELLTPFPHHVRTMH